MSQLSRYYSTDFKQRVLEQYQSGVRGYGFKSLAQRFSITGGHQTIADWYSDWDGTEQSLISKPREGRPPILTSSEITNHIDSLVRRRNQQHRSINYRTVHDRVQLATGKLISNSSIRRIGRGNCRIKSKTTITRTEVECEYYYTIHFNLILLQLTNNLIIYSIFLLSNYSIISAL